VLQALHVDPAKRFQDADAMRRELEALGHRYRLVLGDAAVSEVLNQLFTDHEEPWLARSTSRAEGEVAVAVEENDTGLTTVLLDPADAALTPTPLPADDLVIAVAEPNTLPVAQPRPTPRAQTVIGPGIAPRNPNDSKPPVLASELAAEALAIPLIAPADDSFAGSRAVTALRKPKKRGGRAWIGFTIVGLVLAGAAGGAVYMFEMGESATAAARPSPPAPAPAAAPVAARQSAPKPPPAPAPAPVVKPTVAPTSVELVIETVPSDATVLLDGQRLGHTPYRGAVDAKPGGHVLKIRRRGCVTQKLDIELTGDVKRDVELAALEGDAGDECQRSREAQQVQLR